MAQNKATTRAGGSVDMRVVLEVGNPYFEPGRTRVELLPDGRALVSNKFEQEERRAEGKMDPVRVAALVDESTLKPALARVADRLGLPDEPRYRVEVERGGQRVLAADIWRSDLGRLPGLEQLVRELEQVVQQASDGQLVL